MKFRKINVIEAVQFDYETFVYKRHAAYPMVDGDYTNPTNPFSMNAKNPKIKTPRGYILVADKDWIITGSNGGYSLCKPHIFEKQYERVYERDSSDESTMTLDEAIKHAEEVAKECTPCGRDHQQLADWLNELRDLRRNNDE